MKNYATKTKIYIVLFTLLFSVNFYCNFSKNKVMCEANAISPNINFHRKAVEDEAVDFEVEDNTQFIFRYQNRQWEYNSKIDNNCSSQFDINLKLNKYKSNKKSEKIKIIKSLQNLKINNKIIINYLFPNLLKKTNKIIKNIEKPAKSAYFSYNKDKNKIDIYNEQIGIKINFNLFFDIILNNFCNTNNIDIEIPVERIEPDITAEKLKLETCLRAKFTTSFSSSSADRKHNIRQAVNKINGIIIAPNQKFSFNEVVGNRTEKNGYRVAKIMNQGELIDGVGGGVCQVSTTLYNAVLLSGLKIEQANKHSERVAYVKSGFDAMVNYGSSDLVFINNTENNVYIYANIVNDKLTFNIFGESLKGYSYKLSSEITDVVMAGNEEVRIDTEKNYIDKVEYSDEFYYLKHARDGCTVKSFREVYYCGNLLSKETLRVDKYKPQNAVKIVGAKERVNITSFTENLDKFLNS